MNIPNRLVVTAVGFNHKMLLDNKREFDVVNEYLRQLQLYTKRWCKERYNLDMDVEYYYSYFIPESYEKLRQFDGSGWRTYFKDFLQMYVVYGKDLSPWSINANGYCECESGTFEMAYCEMPKYHKIFTSGDPYRYWMHTGRTFLHELEHGILRMLGHSSWLKGVHKAMNMTLLERVGEVDKMGKLSRFWIQQDGRYV